MDEGVTLSYQITVPSQLLRDTEIPPMAKIIYMALSARMGPDGWMRSGQEAVAYTAGISPKTVQRLIPILERRGFVSVRRLRDPVSGLLGPHEYRVWLDPRHELDEFDDRHPPVYDFQPFVASDDVDDDVEVVDVDTTEPSPTGRVASTNPFIEDNREPDDDRARWSPPDNVVRWSEHPPDNLSAGQKPRSQPPDNLSAGSEQDFRALGGEGGGEDSKTPPQTRTARESAMSAGHHREQPPPPGAPAASRPTPAHDLAKKVKQLKRSLLPVVQLAPTMRLLLEAGWSEAEVLEVAPRVFAPASPAGWDIELAKLAATRPAPPPPPRPVCERCGGVGVVEGPEDSALRCRSCCP